jgi:hypothetical protein
LRAEAKTITSAKSVSKLGSQVELGGLTEPLFHLSNENRSTWVKTNIKLFEEGHSVSFSTPPECTVSE